MQTEEIDDIIALTTSDRPGAFQWVVTMSEHRTAFPEKYFVVENKQPRFVPFTLHVRTMHTYGELVEESTQNIKQQMKELSPLSEGVPCATQRSKLFFLDSSTCGTPKNLFCLFTVELFAIVHPTGIFVWWPDTYALNASHLTINFRTVPGSRNASRPAPRFTSQIVGTRSKTVSFRSWHDVEASLVNIPVNSSAVDPSLSLDGSTQLRVAGSVTGILIPNINQVSMRVIAPIMDNGHEVVLNNSFVQWTNVRVISN